ncbi:MAG: hypothetical protein E4G89_00305 [Methanothrix sp.]|nr:MAG: hypothetical protein E4G89_00305 [Methanothrix sp.]
MDRELLSILSIFGRACQGRRLLRAVEGVVRQVLARDRANIRARLQERREASRVVEMISFPKTR